MKKVSVYTGFGIAFLLILGMGIIGNAVGGVRGRGTAAPGPGPERSEARHRIALTLDVDEGRREAAGEMRMRWVNHTDAILTEIVFALRPNAQRRADSGVYDGADREAYPDGFSRGEIDVESVRVDGAVCGHAVEGEAGELMRVTLPGPLLPGQAAQVEMGFVTAIPRARTPFGMDGRDIRLVGAYPIPAVYEDGAFRAYPPTRFGDTLYAEAADYDVTLRMAKGYEVGTAGRVIAREMDAGRETVRIEANGVRAWSGVLGRGAQVFAGQVGETAVMVRARTGYSGKLLLEAACRAVEALEGMYGKYPYPAFTVVESDVCDGTSVGSGMGIVDAGMVTAGRREAFEREVTVLAARQWFGGKVGSDGYARGWMSDGLSAYGAMAAMRRSGGERAANRYFLEYVEPMYDRTANAAYAPVERSVGDFAQVGEYDSVVRAKAVYMMLELEGLMGEDGVERALHGYAEANAYGIARTEDLLRAVEDAGGAGVSGLITDYLDGRTGG